MGVYCVLSLVRTYQYIDLGETEQAESCLTMTVDSVIEFYGQSLGPSALQILPLTRLDSFCA